MDGLSLHITEAVTTGLFSPLKLGRNIQISHSFFVDDVLILGLLNRFSWCHLFQIFHKFGIVSGLKMNHSKSVIMYNLEISDTIIYIANLFGIPTKCFSSGLKYLGFHLKPSKYRNSDWNWLVYRYYLKISTWENKCLSLGGRFTLVQAVITQISVYGVHLFYLPTVIIKKLDSITAIFIWSGMKHRQKFHLIKLRHMSLPKSMDGWGILDLRRFGQALLLKSTWRGFLELVSGVTSSIVNT